MAKAPLMPVDEALERILAAVPGPTRLEDVPLSEAYGRVLGEDIVATRTQPPADLSAMDGYAVRASDCKTVPCELTLVGQSQAGRRFDGVLGPDEAVRIFTGAPLPDGADSIIIQENTERDGADARVRILTAAEQGRHIRKAGIDFRAGEVGLTSGRRLGPADIALAAAMNVPTLPVWRRPVIAFFSTGDELVPPGAQLGPDQIVSSNNAALDAMIRAAGGEPLDLGIAPDDADRIRETARGARGAEMLITVGGASVGDHDLVQPALADDGLDIAFWRIAMRPGKPLMFGSYAGKPMLGLPGNPVSAFVCAQVFLRPAIAKLTGAPHADLSSRAPLAVPLKENDQRRDYLRGRWVEARHSGDMCVEAFETQDSSLLSVLAHADLLIVREPHAPAAEAGDVVTIIPLK